MKTRNIKIAAVLIILVLFILATAVFIVDINTLTKDGGSGLGDYNLPENIRYCLRKLTVIII